MHIQMEHNFDEKTYFNIHKNTQQTIDIIDSLDLNKFYPTNSWES